MGSSFAGLSTALSGLYTARRALDLTGQNVANANTEGYTRQRLTLEAQGAPVTPALYSTYDGVGSGVGVSDIARLRDSFLESRGHTEHGRSSYLSTRAAALAQVEDTMAEPGDSGLQSQMSEFYNAWHDVANAPGDGAARSQLLQRAGTLTDSMHQTAESFATQWRGAHTQLSTLVDEVNTAAGALAELNVAITRDTQAGIPANELADKRDTLIMKLADKIGATVKAGKDGAIDVYVGGTALVRGAAVQKLEITGATTYDEAMATPPVKVALTWKNDGYPAAVELGEAAGHLDTLNNVLPTYGGKLDAFAADFAAQVNAIHRDGYGSDGVTGRDFFSGTTAASLTIAIANKDEVGSSIYGGGKIDGTQAGKIAALASSATGPDTDYRQLITDLGVDAQTANRRSDIQETITSQVDASRDSEAGVDMDEEMTNMLAYQHAYDGAARVLTAIDEALDTLINNTGRVGR